MEKQCNASKTSYHLHGFHLQDAKYKDRLKNRYCRKGNLNEKGGVARVGDFGLGHLLGVNNI